MTLTAEFQLENYKLESEIGHGSLTTVYQARRKSDNALVAVKVVDPEFIVDDIFVKRFKDAARQAARLEHPNIVSTYEANQEGETVYVVREMIEGRLLAQVIAEDGPFLPQRMLLVARQIAAALDYAHQKSITHGDLSVNNIYLALNDQVTVADFGQTQAQAGTSLAQPGLAISAPETTAPERVHGQGPTRQSDLYALGIICYQMLAGEPPFKGSVAAVLQAQAYEQPRPLHLVNPSVPVALSEAIQRMLAKGLELRYNTGSEFTRALEVAIQGTAPLRAPAAAAAQLKAAGLNRPSLGQQPLVWLILAIVIIGVLLILGFGAVSWWSLQSSSVDAPLPANTSVVSPAPTAAATAPTETSPGAVALEQDESVTLITVTSSPTLTPTFTPTVTPTPAPIPTPGPPVVADNSPFTNLVIARGITADEQPEKVGASFAPGSTPIYLFFNYEAIEPGTSWAHRWTWGDTELDTYEETWPDYYNESGVAWVYYSPAGGYQPGPYTITLEVNGEVVATVTFVVQPGGL